MALEVNQAHNLSFSVFINLICRHVAGILGR